MGLLWGQAKFFSALSRCPESFQRQRHRHLSEQLTLLTGYSHWEKVSLQNSETALFQVMPADSHPPTVLHGFLVDSAMLKLTSGFNGIKDFFQLTRFYDSISKDVALSLFWLPLRQICAFLRVPQASLLQAEQTLVSKPQLIRQVIQSWLPWCLIDVFPEQDTEIRICVISSEQRYE